jgi:hypothetical protein
MTFQDVLYQARLENRAFRRAAWKPNVYAYQDVVVNRLSCSIEGGRGPLAFALTAVLAEDWELDRQHGFFGDPVMPPFRTDSGGVQLQLLPKVSHDVENGVRRLGVTCMCGERSEITITKEFARILFLWDSGDEGYVGGVDDKEEGSQGDCE